MNEKVEIRLKLTRIQRYLAELGAKAPFFILSMFVVEAIDAKIWHIPFSLVIPCLFAVALLYFAYLPVRDVPAVEDVLLTANETGVSIKFGESVEVLAPWNKLRWRGSVLILTGTSVKIPLSDISLQAQELKLLYTLKRQGK